MKTLGIMISSLQILTIVVIYMINPIGALYQAGWLTLCVIGSIGPSVIATAKRRVKIVGFVMEVLYLYAALQLYDWSLLFKP